ncbi:MAG: glycoside-pentoside-hexuronide (GPH):cation symporter [Gemmiger sp.]|nr:glycoside-pentoside-hexuronide (GPH):cation symporter [Gemmiger sp.]
MKKTATAAAISNQTTLKERVSYLAFSSGQCILYSLFTSYLQIYFTDIGITAAVVGLIFLGARIWDAINDPLFGIIVDKSKRKGGKYKPWLKLSSFLLPIFTVLLFAIPSSLSIGVKTLLATGLYVCWGMAYTVCDIPFFSVVTAMTGNVHERTKIVTQGRTIIYIAGILPGIAIPLLYPTIGWTATAIIVATVSLITMVPLGFTAKERNISTEEQSPNLNDLFRAVVQNKFMLVMLCASVVSGLTNSIMTVMGYFAIYNLGNVDMMILMNMLPMVPALIIGTLAPAITKRIDKFTLYMVFLVGNCLFSVIIFFVGYSNVVLFLVCHTIRNACFFSTNLFLNMFFLDCAEYRLYKTGKNTTGVIMSMSTFNAKIIGAASGSVTMLLLGAVGFISGDVAAQPVAVTDMIWFMMSLFPAIGQLIAIIILKLGYKLRDKDVQLMTKANQGEISREECESQLSVPLKAKR